MPGLSQRIVRASALGLALSGLVGACSGGSTNNAPIIDYVESPPSVSAVNGSYEIPMTIGFHDNDQEVVTRVRYRASQGIDGVVEIKTPIPTRQSADVTLVIPAAAMAPGERRALEITIIDGRGAESRPLAQTVTFE